MPSNRIQESVPEVSLSLFSTNDALASTVRKIATGLVETRLNKPALNTHFAHLNSHTRSIERCFYVELADKHESAARRCGGGGREGGRNLKDCTKPAGRV